MLLTLFVGCRSGGDQFGDVRKIEFFGMITLVDKATNTIGIESLSRSQTGAIEKHGVVYHTFTPDTAFFDGKRRIGAADLMVGQKVKYHFADGSGYRPLLISLKLMP
jgi:hypothetical protein